MTPVYGMSASLFGDIPFSDIMRKLQAGGWKQVELNFQTTPATAWFANVPEARRRLDSAGIAVPSVHISSAAWNLADPDPAVRAAAFAEALSCLPPAAELGSRVVVCHHNAPGKIPFDQQDRGASIARAREALVELAARAHELGLRLAVENLPQRHTPRVGGPVEDVLEIIRDLGDHVGICIDAGHSNANGLDAAEEARIAGGKLLAVHIQDSDGTGADQHLMPGDGTTDWKRFIQTLDETAPTCIRTFEVGAANADPDDIAQQLTRLREDWMAV